MRWKNGRKMKMQGSIIAKKSFDYTGAGVLAPRVGSRGCYHPPSGYTSAGAPIWPADSVWFTVTAVDSALAYRIYDDGTTGLFIWRFRDGPNIFHSWKTWDPLNRLKDDPRA